MLSFTPALPPRCGKGIPGEDTHSQCLQSLSPAHDMNVCAPSLTSGNGAQQCRAMRLCLWNLEPQSMYVLSRYSPSMWGSWGWHSIWAPLTMHVVGWLIEILPIWITEPHFSLRLHVLLPRTILLLFHHLRVGWVLYLRGLAHPG